MKEGTRMVVMDNRGVIGDRSQEGQQRMFTSLSLSPRWSSVLSPLLSSRPLLCSCERAAENAASSRRGVCRRSVSAYMAYIRAEGEERDGSVDRVDSLHCNDLDAEVMVT